MQIGQSSNSTWNPRNRMQEEHHHDSIRQLVLAVLIMFKLILII